MAHIDIDIEDYLDEVDDHYLIKELMRRFESKNEKIRLSFKNEFKEILKEYDDDAGWPAIETLVDIEKKEYIVRNWNNLIYK